MLKRLPRDRRAFSLLELLAVLSILALLASILFPVFTEAKRQAAKASCAGNLRQIGLSFALYGSDWDDYYPAAINSWDRQNQELMTEFPKPWNAIPTITDALAPYTKSLELWHCPLDDQSFKQLGSSYEVSDREFFGKPQTAFNGAMFKVANDYGGWHSNGFEWSGPSFIRWRENDLFGDGRVEYGFRRIFIG